MFRLFVALILAAEIVALAVLEIVRPGTPVLALVPVVPLTLVVALLALLWVAHAVWDSRHRDPHDPSVVRARERRGF